MSFANRIALVVALLLATGCKTTKPERDPLPEDRAVAGADDAEPAEADEPAHDLGPVSAQVVAVPADIAAKVKLERVVRKLKRPVALESIPGDTAKRLFIVQQAGLIRILRGAKLDSAPFADLSKEVGRRHNEQGLLGLAFHPRFDDNRKLYVNYTDKKGTTRVVEYAVDAQNADRLDPGSAREVFSLAQPYGNHNGGGIEFGPDGMLYIGTGDGGAANDPLEAGQDRKNLLGKMLRVDVDTAGAKAEVMAIGLRNPWRFHFDSTGDLYIADGGQDKWEEVDVAPAGKLKGMNFGWNVMEANHCFQNRSCEKTGLAPAVVEYDHKTGCSVTGGEVSRGKALPEIAPQSCGALRGARMECASTGSGKRRSTPISSSLRSRASATMSMASSTWSASMVTSTNSCRPISRRGGRDRSRSFGRWLSKSETCASRRRRRRVRSTKSVLVPWSTARRLARDMPRRGHWLTVAGPQGPSPGTS
jgi:glucose/arabinose dehydrogenase